jgi:hypothetical protein
MRVVYEDKRKYRRVEANAPGTIITIGSGLRVGKQIGCRIVNISEGGALIEAESPLNETEFYLEMKALPPNLRLAGTLRLCAVMRRVTSNLLGVQFVE